MWKRVRLAVMGNVESPHAAVIDELLDSLVYGFRELGAEVDVAGNVFIEDGVNVVFFAHAVAAENFPPGSVIYNLEQIFDGLPSLTPAFRANLDRFTVWDYSRRNLDAIRAMVTHDRLQHVPIGYAPVLSRIDPASPQDIDVHFYGSFNDRRESLLDRLRAAGLVVCQLYPSYGRERDALIARAKIVLNVHFYPETKIFESVRVSYLLANGKAVVTERDPETEIPAAFLEGCSGVPYEGIVDECVRLVRDDEARRALEQRGRDAFRKCDVVPILDEAMRRYEARG